MPPVEIAPLTLTIGSQVFGGWKSARIKLSIETLANGYTVTASERWPGDSGGRRIRTGDRATLKIGSTTVITGPIDAVRVRYDASNHEVEFAGRDATGDLVDCSADHTPGEWRGLSIQQLVTELAKPFGVGVSLNGDGGKSFETFRLNDGETAAAAIERLCRHRGLLRIADGLGGLQLTRAGTARAPAGLVLGENVIEAQGQFDDTQRFSRYRVKGQRPSIDLQSPDQVATPSAIVEDHGINRYRPLVVIAEEPGTPAQYAVRAQWEANTRFGKSRRCAYTVAGWTANGQLWRPNQLVHVRDRFIGVDETMIIAGVDFSLDEQGSRTQIEVTRPQAFELQPMPEMRTAVTL